MFVCSNKQPYPTCTCRNQYDGILAIVKEDIRKVQANFRDPNNHRYMLPAPNIVWQYVYVFWGDLGNLIIWLFLFSNLSAKNTVYVKSHSLTYKLTKYLTWSMITASLHNVVTVLYVCGVNRALWTESLRWKWHCASGSLMFGDQ